MISRKNISKTRKPTKNKEVKSNKLKQVKPTQKKAKTIKTKNSDSLKQAQEEQNVEIIKEEVIHDYLENTFTEDLCKPLFMANIKNLRIIGNENNYCVVSFLGYHKNIFGYLNHFYMNYYTDFHDNLSINSESEEDSIQIQDENKNKNIDINVNDLINQINATFVKFKLMNESDDKTILSFTNFLSLFDCLYTKNIYEIDVSEALIQEFKNGYPLNFLMVKNQKVQNRIEVELPIPGKQNKVMKVFLAVAWIVYPNKSIIYCEEEDSYYEFIHEKFVKLSNDKFSEEEANYACYFVDLEH
ncbi:hypothetical protein TRFO_03058 [Tritrichomonas foetus]|uniref:Uncharacterized protein n=1 Tax=Tritrichomonas foetus TaxID=1144522 RepID=A0A1J4KYI7_9EUKA|nr:hypothetical protein TRFO_03058 [Tritrichomonas foetus]|eukprot:OHT14772.1 hypothetical protein TRFO_03058 [Tritrichomonas foetus]